jgi:two-component system phosphate regulon sensor histidine kinase PhoR
MWRGPRTLVWRLGLALIAAEALIALAVGWYLIRGYTSLYQDQVTEELARVTPLLASRYDRLIDSEPVEAIDRIVKADGDLTGLRITLIRADGTVIADSHAFPAQMQNHANRPEIRSALREGDASSVRRSATLRLPMLYVAHRLTRPNDEPVIVRTARPMRAIEAETQQHARIIAAGGGLAVVLTFIVIYLVSRRLSGQISAVSEGAARFASGDLTHRIDRPGAAELATLANSLNDMAQQLDARIGELESQQFEQQAILQSMSNGVIALDIEQRILNMNRAAAGMFGLNGKAARGRLLQEVIRHRPLHRFVREALYGEASSSTEFTLHSGDQIVLEATSERLVGSDGQPKGLLIVLHDVTQVRRFEALRSDFAANVSHELRTPITNIKGYVETLLELDREDRENQERFFTIIKQNCGRLAAIVEDVMALSQLEAPITKDTLEREPTPATHIVKSVLDQYQALAESRKITFDVRIPEDLRANVRSQLIEQALSNLIMNAISYSPSKTTVTVSARRRGDEIEIAVADEGPGIPKEHHSRLFERFYRVDKARSRAIGGTGLGLAIVKHITLAHGGRVELDSEPGKGSTFRLVLPAA